jgi:transposase
METCQQVVRLSEEEHGLLVALVSKGKASAREIRRANTLLQLESGTPESLVARSLSTSISTVRRTRRRFLDEGLSAALSERPRPGATSKLDGKAEALLVALACSTPPEPNTVWTMQLLADRVVALGVVETISDETVRRALKKTRSSPG